MTHGGPIAVGMQREFERLIAIHGPAYLPLYEEQGVYNFYLKNVETVKDVSATEKTEVKAAVNRRPVLP